MTAHAWLILSAVFVLIEILPPVKHFFVLCLSFGAVAAAIATVFSAATWLPWVVFVVVSAAVMPLLIPLAKFIFTK